MSEAFALKAMRPAEVSRHAFSPLLHYNQTKINYKKNAETGVREIVRKFRPISYPSHRDACILAYYAHILSRALDVVYKGKNISNNVIAYRPLGQANYHFAAEAMSFAQAHSPATILAFDISSFFNNLDHFFLKQRLKSLLGVGELSDDWYKVFRFITNYHYVELEELKAHPMLGPQLKKEKCGPIANLKELKKEGIAFHRNPELREGRRRGIPQGTPISAALSNLYMLQFDEAAKNYCDEIHAFYRRYSDDILIICKPEDASELETKILNLIAGEKLEIAPSKTEKTLFDKGRLSPRASKAAQYLGFTFNESGPSIRGSSLARQWRKMRRAIRHAEKSALIRQTKGCSGKIYTKKLYKRFNYIKFYQGDTLCTLKNFASYGRRSAKAFEQGEQICRQVRRLERAARREIAKIKTNFST
ncbi:reverse transcriptase/maturase family protein [Candidatus Kirkpatrickella diaphorinae]|uniref:Reverse transcriptase/maturase family protein n=1 Tax=Candidatus Kirkpatrickella diaphorinae TaxID=2984322 RepID=A0ABY6GMG6_9PROT|nr:reverse transcriptase/maturase family protein [Candidatus Kirkpatrickella diaphorinae]UYH52088.1 reverse transcriptase/maturase family protein [Candidatus Kirkpatrickella diaphorinae]